jgi:nitroimidazol reductase NimA-like FMN-containing flavoprotein (pyridoxamine 5'-phosphate oxidase superfamily)
MQTTVDQLEPAQKEKIINFLQAHPVGVLASVDEGNPHASPLYINTDDKLNITFTTKKETRKYENIAKHNTVMLVVYDGASQSSVQVQGKAVELQNLDDKYAVYGDTLKSAQKSGSDVVPPIAKVVAGQNVAFTIEVENIWMNEWSGGDSFANAMKHAKDSDRGVDAS